MGAREVKGYIIYFLAIHQPYPRDSLSIPSTLRGKRTAFSPCSSYCRTQCLTINASLTSYPKRFRYFVPFRCIPEISSHRFVMPYVSGIVDVLLLTCMYSDLTLGDGASSKSHIQSIVTRSGRGHGGRKERIRDGIALLVV